MAFEHANKSTDVLHIHYSEINVKTKKNQTEIIYIRITETSLQ